MSKAHEITTKKCFKCHKEKPLKKFYKHSEMADGYLNKCIECTKKDALIHRKNNLEKIREYDRNRPNERERSKKHNERMKLLKIIEPDKYRYFRKKRQEWAKQNREKSNARQIAWREAMKNNSKPSNCQLCGVKTSILDGHHYDYNKPKDVTWLCKRCHGLAHRAINEDKRKETI